MKCDKCKNEFAAGNQTDGTPNGVGFEMADGTIITLCNRCIKKLGSLEQEDKYKFFDELFKE